MEKLLSLTTQPTISVAIDYIKSSIFWENEKMNIPFFSLQKVLLKCI
jgi:hypothetical protein